MKIAVAKEIDPSEPRVAASPDTVKKFKALGVGRDRKRQPWALGGPPGVRRGAADVARQTLAIANPAVPKLPVLRIVSAGNVAGEGAKMALMSMRERAAALAAKPPQALLATKELLKGEAYRSEVSARIEQERVLFERQLGSPEAREAMSAFLEKRPADRSRY